AADFADAAARLIAQAAGHLELAEVARMKEFHRLAQPDRAAALRARLTDTVVLAGRFDNAPAFADVMADRLLDVNVLAGLQGPDGGQGVPVVRRGDADDVNRLVFDHLANVLLKAGHLPLSLFRGGHAPADPRLIGVAQDGHDAIVSPGQFGDVPRPPTANADYGRVQPF